MLIVMFALPILTYAQQRDELQELIDQLASAPATRAAGTVTDIDLSAYSEPRTTTLYIRNGVNVRFVNGTLTRATSLTDAPLVQIKDDSKLHLSETASITGNNFYTAGVPVVEVLDGELYVEGGKISENTKKEGNTITIGASVTQNDEQSLVNIANGEIQELIQRKKSSRMYAYGGKVGTVYVYGVVYLKSTTISNCYFLDSDSYIYLEDGDYSSSSILLLGCESNQAVVRNVKTKESVGYFYLRGNEYVLVYENNSIVVHRKKDNPNYIYNEGQLRERMKEIADQNESSSNNYVDLTIAPDGFDLSWSVIIPENCYVKLSGGPLNFNSYERGHSPFMIEGACGLELDNITIDLKNYLGLPSIFENLNYLSIGSGTKFLNINSEQEYFYENRGLLSIAPLKETLGSGMSMLYFSFYNDSKPLVLIKNSLRYTWTIDGSWNELDLADPYTLISGTDGYEIAESDFKYMEFQNLPSDLRVYYDSKDRKVKLRKGNGEIESEDDLQKRLDEIAQSDEKSGEIVIATKGIMLTKGVYVRSKTDITLTGGTISLADTFNDDAAFYIEDNAHLSFNTINFDLRKVYLPSSFVYSPSSDNFLYVGEGTEFLNFYDGQKVMYRGLFWVNHQVDIFGCGNIEVPRGSVIYGSEFSCYLRNCYLKSTGGVPTIAGKGSVVMYEGAKVYGDGKATAVIDIPEGLVNMLSEEALIHADYYGFVVNARSGHLYGKLEGGEAKFGTASISGANITDISTLDKLILTGEAYEDMHTVTTIAGNANLPRLYVMNGVKIDITSSLTNTWIIDGAWADFDLTEPYVLISGYNDGWTWGYTVTEEDYSRMQFANLPDDMETVYNMESHVVQLQKKEVECDLQSLIDGLCDAGEEVPIPEDPVDIGCQEDPLQCAVDRTLDGGDEKDDNGRPQKVICMCAPTPVIQIVRINQYSSLTIRNFNIRSSMFENQNFLVYGTLVIDVNVYIYRFIRFIHIMPGGHVIWRGGHVEDVDEIVYNEGGTLEIDGDFDNGGKTLVNPEGGTIIIKSGTFNCGIENHGTVIVEGGTILGGIENYGTITVTGGTIDGGRKPGLTNYDGGTATIDGGVIKCDGGAIYEIENHEGGNMVLHDGACVGDNGTGCLRSETDIWIGGGVRVTEIYIKRGVRIHVIGKLNVTWRIFFFDFNDFDVYVPFIFGDEGYEMTEEDFSRLEIRLPEGYRLEFYEGYVVIVRIPYNVTTIVEYLEYFGPKGTPGNPWSFIYNTTNIDINIDWHIKRDYHLIFDGGTFTMNGGDIYIDDGASLWLKNITFKGTGHIYVYGTLYIDANVDFAEILRFIHICKGGVIRFIAQPSYTVRIFIEGERIVVGDVVIYDVLEEWLKTLTIELPDGYEWEYDESLHTILIKKTEVDGILDVRSDAVQSDIYDLYGRKVENPIEGKLYICNGKKFVIRK